MWLTSSPAAFQVLRPDRAADRLSRKIVSLTELPVGWHFGDGVAVTPQAAATACRYWQLLQGICGQANVFPVPDGSLLLVFYAADRCVEISIDRDGSSLDLALEQGRGPEFAVVREVENASEYDVLSAVGALVNEYASCRSPEFFIQDTTIETREDLEARAFPTPATAAESRWSIWTAFPSDQIHPDLVST